MLSMRDMGRISVVVPFEICAMVNSFDGLGVMPWMREKSIVHCLRDAYCGGRRARTLRVKVLW